MKPWWPKACVTSAALMLMLIAPGSAGDKSTDDLKKEIESLKVMMQGMQKDLQEVKGMLARQAQAVPPPAGIGTVLDLGGAMVQGEKTAKLTLVEVSDYQ
jgi:protein-disulfide isomerase